MQSLTKPGLLDGLGTAVSFEQPVSYMVGVGVGVSVGVAVGVGVAVAVGVGVNVAVGVAVGSGVVSPQKLSPAAALSANAR